MTKLRRWDNRWEEVKKLGAGGQGHTYLVRNLTDPSCPLAVLKELKRQDDMERRKRLHREVVALDTLDHRYIPRLIESNSATYRDLNTKLYFVIEHADGQSLSQFVETKGPMDLRVAISFMSLLLDAVGHCHSVGIVHRDIKPDNIIVRENLEPALLDLGLSFNQEDLASLHTASEQQLGNRFLHLPELQVVGSEKRDLRADVTQCCAIFYYIITGLYPVSLSDHRGLKPHQSANAEAILSRLSRDTALRLKRLFDVGFEIVIDRRYASASTLRQAIEAVERNEQDLSPDSEHKMINAIKQRLTGGIPVEQKLEIDKRLRSLEDVVRAAVLAVSEGFDGLLQPETWGSSINHEDKSCTYLLGFRNSINGKTFCRAQLVAKVSGPEIVVTGVLMNATLNGPYGEVLDVDRIPIVSGDHSGIQHSVRRFLLQILNGELPQYPA